MNYLQFTSKFIRMVYVKIPLFDEFGSSTFYCVSIPSDWFDFISENSKYKIDGIPVISLSYYVFLLRFRKAFKNYIKETKLDNFL